MSISWGEVGKNKVNYASIIKSQKQVIGNLQNKTKKNIVDELEMIYNNIAYSKNSVDKNSAYTQIAKNIIKNIDARFNDYNMGLKTYNNLTEKSTRKKETMTKEIEAALLILNKWASDGVNASEVKNKITELQQKVKQATSKTDLLSDKNFIDNYNTQIIDFLNKHYRQKTGDIFEIILNDINNQIEVFGSKVSSEIIGNSSFGTQASISIKNLSSEAIEQLENEGYVLDEHGSRMEFKMRTSDKADIKITINDGDYFLSLKNHQNPNKEIHISSQTKLASLLSSSKVKSQFSTAFLETVWYGGHDISQAQAIIDTSKYVVGSLMLTGAGFQNTSAEILVINDRSKRHIYCFSIGDIIEKIENNLNILKLTNYPKIKQFKGVQGRQNFEMKFLDIMVAGQLNNLLTTMGRDS